MQGENTTASSGSDAIAESDLLGSLRMVLKDAREASREALPAAVELLAQARTAHTDVLAMLRGRIRDFAVEKEAFEKKISELESVVAAKEQQRLDAERMKDAAEASALSARGKLGEARAERDTLSVQLDSALEEKKRIEATFVSQEATFQNERDDFLRQSQSLGVKLQDAQTRIETLAAEKSSLEARQQILENENKRLGDELVQKAKIFDKKIQEMQVLLDKALLEKAAADSRLATLQEQWERLSR